MSVKGFSETKISALGQYEGYSSPEYDGNSRHSVYFTASDGKRLAVDVLIPSKNGVEETRPLPVIFHYTPYGRVIMGRDCQCNKELEPDGMYFDDIGLEGLIELGAYGYVIVIADIRGTGASFGARYTTNSRREAEDGREIIAWIKRQSFCNGKIGTAGYSYTGQSQLECLSTGTKDITASFICMTDIDKYDGWVRDGIPRAFGTQPDIIFGDSEDEITATVERLAAETVPVDGDEDRVLLRQAIREHVDSGLQIPIMRDLNWRNSYLEASGGEHWKVIGMSSYLDNINSSGAAVYLVGGVYDVFRRDTILLYHNISLTKKMIMGPWYHMDKKVDVRWDVEMRRWFDYWLKGIDNGIMDEPPVDIRMANYNFHTHSLCGANTGYYVEKDHWDPEAGERSTVYLDGGRVLTSCSLENGAVVSECPKKETAVAYTDGYNPGCSIEQPLTSNDAGNAIDQLGLTFTSAPLERDRQIVGHPMARVSFSLEDPGYMKENYDVDVFVHLIDYDPAHDEGFLVTSGQLRASMRAESGEVNYNFLGLPWHRCNIGDNEYLELGKKYELLIDLLPTSYILKKGHCLRITITNSIKNMYYLGRKEYEADPDFRKPRINIYTGGSKGSRVEIPNIYA